MRDQASIDLAALTRQLKERAAEGNNAQDTKKLVSEVLQSSIKAIKSGDKDKQLLAYRELKAVRGELSNLTMESQEEREKFIALYDRAIHSNERAAKALGVVAKDLTGQGKGMLPTLKSFGKAMIANSHPALRVVMDLASDVKSYAEETLSKAEAEAKAELDKVSAETGLMSKEDALVEKEDKLADLQREVATEQKELIQEQREEAKGRKKSEAKKDGLLVSRMEAVRQQTALQTSILESLLSAVGGEGVQRPSAPVAIASSPASATSTLPSLDEQPILERLDRQLDELDGVNEQLEKMVEVSNRTFAMQEDAARESQKNALTALENENKRRGGLASGAQGALKPDDKAGGFLSELFGNAFGAIIGSLIPKVLGALNPAKLVGAVMPAIKGLFGGLGKLLKVSKAIPVIGTAIAAITAIFDFFDGFSNAASILGKADVNLWDKISAGIGAIFGGIVGIFDSIAGLLGFNTDFGTTVKTAVAKALAKIPELLMGAFNLVKDGFTSLMPKVGEAISSVGQWISDTLGEWAKGIPDILLSMIPGGHLIKKAIEAMTGGGEKPKQEAESKPQTAKVEVDPAKARFPVVEKAKRQEVDAMDRAIEDKKKVVAPQVIAPTSNKVDASSTNVFTQPMFARNRDDSLRTRMGYGSVGIL